MITNQFGKSPAAINLEDILRKEPRLVAIKVAAKICKYQGLLNSVKQIKNLEHKKLIAGLVRAKYTQTITNLNVDEKIKDHTLNVLAVNYRKVIGL